MIYFSEADERNPPFPQSQGTARKVTGEKGENRLVGMESDEIRNSVVCLFPGFTLDNFVPCFLFVISYPFFVLRF